MWQPIYQLNLFVAIVFSLIYASDLITISWMMPDDSVWQSDLPHPILQNSVESDHGRTLRIFFDNVDDNVTLTLYIKLLTSQKPC